jgi:PKD repeat protein
VGGQATFTQPGRYQLIVGNTAGCFDTINFIITNCKQFSDSEFDSTLTDFPLTGLRVLLALDYNNDNYEDIFALNPQGYLRLYENTTALNGGRKAGYLDVTAGAGLPENLAVYQILPADYDNDGNPDLFCFRSGELRIFRYSGAGKTAGGKYTEVTADLCLRNPFLGDTAYSSTVLDIEPDGDPDIIAMRKRATDNSRILALNRADAIACNPVTSYCAESLLVDLGINVDPLVRYFDFDLDNDLDLLVLAYNQALPNIEHPVKLYRNDNGSFEDATVRSRLDDYQMSFPGFATIADFNEDGRPDILGGSMNSSTARNRVLQGTDIGTFVDASGLFLLKTQNYLYHQANTVDIDNDGDPDVSWATQGINEPFLLFRNQGVPNFVESSDSLGLSKRNVPNAVWTDADNDGDLDLFLSTPAGQSWYLRNNTDTAKNRFLRIRLAGCRALKDGRGATVTVVTKNKRITQYYLHGIGSNAATGNILHFGLANADKADTIIVKWIGGNQSRLVNIAANQLITIQENTPCLDTVPEAKFSITPIDNDSLKLAFTNQSIGADRYFWIFGDGQTSFEANPTKIYQQRGNYTIQLVAFNRCGSDTANYVWQLLSRQPANENLSFRVYPNPAHEKVIITLQKPQPAGTPIEITLVDIHGKTVRLRQALPDDLKMELDLSDVAAGYYTLILKSDTASGFQKLVLLPKLK